MLAAAAAAATVVATARDVSFPDQVIVMWRAEAQIPSKAAEVLRRVEAAEVSASATGAKVYRISRALTAAEVTILEQTGAEYVETDELVAGVTIEPGATSLDREPASESIEDRRVSNIARAIEWLVGGHVPGLPLNPHPVSTITLSFSKAIPCGAALTAATELARARHSTVLAATRDSVSEYDPTCSDDVTARIVVPEPTPPPPPPRPSSVRVNASVSASGSYTLSWTLNDAVPNAAGSYTDVRRYLDGVRLPNVTSPSGSTSIGFRSVPSGDMTHQVRRCTLSGCSAYTAEGALVHILPPSRPTSLTSSDWNSRADGVYTVTADASAGASYYKFSRRCGSNDWSAPTVTHSSNDRTVSFSYYPYQSSNPQPCEHRAAAVRGSEQSAWLYETSDEF